VLRNADYIGGTGYPAILSTDRFEHVQGLLGQRDLTGQRRAGTPRAAEDFPLSSVVRCGHCGAAMRSRRCSTTGRRTYRCSNAMEGRHLCRDSRPDSELRRQLQTFATRHARPCLTLGALGESLTADAAPARSPGEAFDRLQSAGLLRQERHA